MYLKKNCLLFILFFLFQFAFSEDTELKELPELTDEKPQQIELEDSINDAIVGIEQRLPYDFIEVDFKNIWDYLGYINGDTVQEDLLDTIFANFCIGK